MTWRRVCRQHKLLFRFDPILDVIEIMVNGKLELIRLDDYRPPQHRQAAQRVDQGARIDIIDQVDHSC